MLHFCDSTVAGPTAQRDNLLASKCEYPPFRYPPFQCARALTSNSASYDSTVRVCAALCRDGQNIGPKFA